MPSLSQALLLGDLSSPHNAFEQHAAHVTEWSVTLSCKDSSGTCIPGGVSTFPHAASRRTASSDSPWHSSAKPPPLEGLSPSHGAFQGHAAHLAEWSATLRPTGSASTCIPEGVSTFFHTAFTAHSDAGADAGGSQVQCAVRPSISEGHCLP